jgi:acetaldehyde dehydrogenase / alcohol dehydrogenase
MEFGAAAEVLRISVNAGNSLGSSGIETHLPPSMTVGTGFFGGSSVAENLQPKHFVQWTRLAYNSDPAEPFGSFLGLIPWEAPAGPVPPYPYASNMADAGGTPAGDLSGAGGGGMGPRTAGTGPGLQAQDLAGLREEIRRLVIEELSQLVGGERRG